LGGLPNFPRPIRPAWERGSFRARLAARFVLMRQNDYGFRICRILPPPKIRQILASFALTKIYTYIFKTTPKIFLFFVFKGGFCSGSSASLAASILYIKVAARESRILRIARLAVSVLGFQPPPFCGVFHCLRSEPAIPPPDPLYSYPPAENPRAFFRAATRH